MNYAAALQRRKIPIAVVDVESTGLDDDSRIVEIAVVHFTLGAPELPVVVLRQRVNPEAPISPGAYRAHGISDADVAEAPTWAEVAPEVLHAMEIGHRTPMAYNAPADYTWLARDCARVGLAFPAFTDVRWLDPLPFVKTEAVDKYKRGKTLLDVCRRRGIAVDAHGAAGDAVATALVAWPVIRQWARAQHGLQPQTDRLAALLRDTVYLALDAEEDYSHYQQAQGALVQPECRWHELLGQRLPPWSPPEPKGECPACKAPARFTVDRQGQVQLTGLDAQPHVCPTTQGDLYTDDVPF